MKIYLGKPMNEFQTALRLEGISEIIFRLGNLYYSSKVVFLVILAREN